MKLYVGVSGFSYKEWKGNFYPKDLPPDRMLAFYAGHFRAVEINSAFYRMPEAATFEKWRGEVPADFRFALKMWQGVTHRQRLRESGPSLQEFLAAAGAFKDQLGPLLFQLPPFFKKDAARLREFLPLLQPPVRATFEFRHSSWFDDEIFNLLREHKVALCIADDDNELTVPFVATADWGYLRLRRTDYGKTDLKKWAERVRAQNWTEAFIFFRHEETGAGPKFAQQFLDLAGDAATPPGDRPDEPRSGKGRASGTR